MGIMDKNILRKEILERRNYLELDNKSKYDKVIFEKLINSDIYKKSKKIFTYISFSSEVDTKKFINYAISDNKDIYVPKTDKVNKEMLAIKINSLNNMNVDKLGILEPKHVDKSKIGDKFDLIIMPGIAFDKNGNRIGYCGGYYDKYISKINDKCVKLALAYELQIVENIKSEIHDIKVDFIITNK